MPLGHERRRADSNPAVSAATRSTGAADEILAVPGVDAVYVGPADLSLAVGLQPLLDQSDPASTQALTAIVAAARRHGVVPTDTPIDTGHDRVRHDRIDSSGVITLRHNSRLHHIGLGRRHAGTRVLVLARDRHIRVLTPTVTCSAN